LYLHFTSFRLHRRPLSFPTRRSSDLRWSTQQFQGYEDATYKATVENLTSDAVASGLQGDFTRQANVANELLMINRSHLQTRGMRSEEHTSELQSRENLVCRLLLEKKK